MDVFEVVDSGVALRRRNGEEETEEGGGSHALPPVLPLGGSPSLKA